MPIENTSPLPDMLAQQVQTNCHITDARYARNYSLCIYLLKMREFYRWEQGYAFGEPLPKEPLGEWLTERERLWEKLEENDFHTIEVSDKQHQPFDNDNLNLDLNELDLVYSGGYCSSKPHFFLAELEQTVEHEGTKVYIAGKELARELTAPPAMSLNNTIYLRRESLRRMIWEKYEEWGGADKQRAIARAMAHYGFEHDLQQALDAMTDDEIQTLLEHELGEVTIGHELGGEWEQMLAALPRSRAEFLLRAIRDHLVDCRRTLPRLLEDGRDAAIHFYMANFNTLRKEIFPALSNAYRKWLEGDGGKALRETVKQGADFWQRQAEEALETYRNHCEDIEQFHKQMNQAAPQL